jgi:hypothetical protein
MEIKIFCACGSKYKFDVEPLNGKLPGPVKCPVCGADGTEKGNAIIAQNLMAPPPAAAPPPAISIPVQPAGVPRIAIPSMADAPKPSPIQIPSPATNMNPAGAPVGSPSATPAMPAISIPASSTGGPARSSKSGFVAPVIPRSSKAAAAQATQASSPAPATAAPATSGGPVPPPATLPVPSAGPVPTAIAAAVNPGNVHSKLSVAAAQSEPPGVAQPEAIAPSLPPVSAPGPASAKSIPAAAASLSRGMIGVALASFASLLAWFVITSVVFGRLKWLAIFVGLAIGWAGRIMGKQRSPRIAIAAAAATVAVVLLGSLWAGHQLGIRIANRALISMYDGEVAYAREAVKAKTDDEIAEVMAHPPNEALEAGEDSDVQKVMAQTTEIDAAKISVWKRTELPELRKFANGEISRAQYEREHRPVIEGLLTTTAVLSRAMGISMIIWMLAGGITAYRVALK